MDGEPSRLQSMGSLRFGHDWMTTLSLFTFLHWRRKRQPLQCSCLENPRDGGAWWAAVYGVAQSRTRLKRLSSRSCSNATSQFSSCCHFIKSVFLVDYNLESGYKAGLKGGGVALTHRCLWLRTVWEGWDQGLPTASGFVCFRKDLYVTYWVFF